MSDQRRGFHTAAPLLLRMGWLPLPVPEGQKAPPPDGLTGMKPEALKVASDPKLWRDRIKPHLEDDVYAVANTAVRLPPNVFALDIDDYVGADGKVKSGWSSLAAFAESFGIDHPARSLPPTLRTTARGAKNISGHRFYRIPDDLDADEVMKSLPGVATPGVEVLRPGHRYTIEAGSLHPEGSVYQVYDERLKKGKRLPRGLGSISPSEIPEIPREWLDALLASRPSTIAGNAGQLDEEARARAKEELDAWIEDNDFNVDDLTNDEAIETLTPGARQATMAFGDPSKNNDNVTTSCISLIATLMEDTADGERAAIRNAIDIARHLYIKGGSEADRPREFDRALAWAFPIAHQAVSTGNAAGAVDWAQGVLDDDFWGQTEVLRSCRDFARAHLVAPDAMLACALAAVASWLPPHLVLPGLVGGVAGLNFYVAIAGASGTGKSAAMKAAQSWLNVRPHEHSDLSTDEPYVTTVSTAQGLVQAYTVTQQVPKNQQTRPGQLEHIQVRRSVRFDVDEIGALGAAMDADGSMLKDFIKTMWTGSGVGTTAAEATRVRKLNDHEFRMVIVAGVQPSTADVILSGHGDGFPQRWLWVEAFDDKPLSIEEWKARRENPPEPLGWDVPLACYPLPVPVSDDDDNKKIVKAIARANTPTVNKFREVGITESFEMKVYHAASGASRRIGDVDTSMSEVLDGHSVLLQEKLAALVAALHGDIDITDQYERIAEWITARSDATRQAILFERHEESMKTLEIQARRQGKSEALASVARADAQVDIVKERLMKAVGDARGGLPVTEALAIVSGTAAGDAKGREFIESMPGLSITGDVVILDLG